LAINNCAVNSPISPKPVTTMVSPNVGCSNRIPCNPIEPTTVKDASSSLTLSGICATKFFGILTNSACCPFEATLSPTLNSLTPTPTAITLPTLQ